MHTERINSKPCFNGVRWLHNLFALLYPAKLEVAEADCHHLCLTVTVIKLRFYTHTGTLSKVLEVFTERK